jgi:hypothetical protein
MALALDQLCTAKEWKVRDPNVSVYTLKRWQAPHRSFRDTCVIRKGHGKAGVLFDPAKVAVWIEEHRDEL